MKYGWTGNRLTVNLTSGKISKEPFPRNLALNFIGGRGINSRMLYDLINPGTDPDRKSVV